MPLNDISVAKQTIELYRTKVTLVSTSVLIVLDKIGLTIHWSYLMYR